MRDRLELLLGIAGSGGDDRTAERVRARLHHEAAGGEMIGEGIVHDVARPEAGGEQRARRTPAILRLAFRLEDRPGRHQQPPHSSRRRDVEAAERRVFLLPRQQLGLAQHRQRGERGPRGTALGSMPASCRGPARRAQRKRDESGSRPKNSRSRASGSRVSSLS